MPWKDGYTISDETSLADDAVRWPEGARCCVAVTVDLSVAAGPDGITAADLASPRAQFGTRAGLEQVLRVLRQFALKATFAVPAVIALAFPDRVRTILAAGHEIAAEGLRHEDVTHLARTDEQARIERTTAILTETTGQRPAGWYSLPRQGDPFAGGTVSPRTMDLLLDAGYGWFGNGLADDIPHFWVTDFASRRAILTLPYYYHYDDQFFLHFPARGSGLEHADSLARNWRAEFAAQYRRGRMFHMTLHPGAIGFAHRLGMLEQFCQHMASRPGLWSATGSMLADWWQHTFPTETHLRLEPSVWRDYPGSLS